MIVVDASILASFILKEPGWERLVDLLKDSYTVDHAVKEVTNAIWKAYRRGIISEEDALMKYQALRKLVGVNVRTVSEEELVSEAFRLSMEHGITVYDALYVVLASRLGKPLATVNQEQVRVAEKLGVKVVHLHAGTR